MLLQKLLSIDSENHYTFYLSSSAKAKFPASVKVEHINEKPGSISEQFHFSHKLKKDKNDLMIFFNEEKPLRYKGDYFVFVKDLKEVHYASKKSTFTKFFQNLFLDTSLENARKVICFEKHTLNEINEKLNIPEHKITIVPPFFSPGKVSPDASIANVKSKYSIK
jgi:hypothetical protein